MPAQRQCPALDATVSTFFFSPSSAVEAQLFVPEGFVEMGEQRSGFRTQLLRAVRFAERIEHLGHAHPGIVDIALKLTESHWPFDQ